MGNSHGKMKRRFSLKSNKEKDGKSVKSGKTMKSAKSTKSMKSSKGRSKSHNIDENTGATPMNRGNNYGGAWTYDDEVLPVKGAIEERDEYDNEKRVNERARSYSSEDVRDLVSYSRSGESEYSTHDDENLRYQKAPPTPKELKSNNSNMMVPYQPKVQVETELDYSNYGIVARGNGGKDMREDMPSPKAKRSAGTNKKSKKGRREELHEKRERRNQVEKTSDRNDERNNDESGNDVTHTAPRPMVERGDDESPQIDYEEIKFSESEDYSDQKHLEKSSPRRYDNLEGKYDEYENSDDVDESSLDDDDEERHYELKRKSNDLKNEMDKFMQRYPKQENVVKETVNRGIHVSPDMRMKRAEMNPDDIFKPPISKRDIGESNEGGVDDKANGVFMPMVKSRSRKTVEREAETNVVSASRPKTPKEELSSFASHREIPSWRGARKIRTKAFDTEANGNGNGKIKKKEFENEENVNAFINEFETEIQKFANSIDDLKRVRSREVHNDVPDNYEQSNEQKQINVQDSPKERETRVDSKVQSASKRNPAKNPPRAREYDTFGSIPNNKSDEVSESESHSESITDSITSQTKRALSIVSNRQDRFQRKYRSRSRSRSRFDRDAISDRSTHENNEREVDARTCRETEIQSVDVSMRPPEKKSMSGDVRPNIQDRFAENEDSQSQRIPSRNNDYEVETSRIPTQTIDSSSRLQERSQSPARFSSRGVEFMHNRRRSRSRPRTSSRPRPAAAAAPESIEVTSSGSSSGSKRSGSRSGRKDRASVSRRGRSRSRRRGGESPAPFQNVEAQMRQENSRGKRENEVYPYNPLTEKKYVEEEESQDGSLSTTSSLHHINHGVQQQRRMRERSRARRQRSMSPSPATAVEVSTQEVIQEPTIYANDHNPVSPTKNPEILSKARRRRTCSPSPFGRAEGTSKSKREDSENEKNRGNEGDSKLDDYEQSEITNEQKPNVKHQRSSRRQRHSASKISSYRRSTASPSPFGRSDNDKMTSERHERSLSLSHSGSSETSAVSSRRQTMEASKDFLTKLKSKKNLLKETLEADLSPERKPREQDSSKEDDVSDNADEMINRLKKFSSRRMRAR